MSLATGLSSSEAHDRLDHEGPNVLPGPASRPAVLRLAGQMVHFFALMLWVAAALAFVAGMPALGWAIGGVVLINGAFSFIQEHRAERAAERLRAMVPQRATVIRDGSRIVIDAEHVVPGDTLVVQAGDRVCADINITTSHALQLDASMLTGESRPQRVSAGDEALAGMLVVDGEGLATVTATGVHTRLASIAKLTVTGRRPQTPLARELQRVVRRIAAIALAVGGAYFLVSLLLGRDPHDGFLFAVGVTVALVPEGLLPTVTLSLAMAAQRMANRNALVRRLESVETLGSTTFVCTDKTGTLTTNTMTVREVWTPAGTTTFDGTSYAPNATANANSKTALDAAASALEIAALCSSGRVTLSNDCWVAQGDPMEAALDSAARSCGVDTDASRARYADDARFVFDPRRRRMSIVREGYVIAKGAPDAMKAISNAPREYDHVVTTMAAQGLRVLAIARRPTSTTIPTTAQQAEQDLQIVGIVGLEDPPRPHARAAINACRRAGIKIAMVTGDHPQTALAIAREVGLYLNTVPVVEGRDLPAGNDELLEIIDQDGVVISRVDPETKLRIARALGGAGHVVAMTGDGVNDGPALHAASIGIAMGLSGSDVAREAADLVLLDDDFATIVVAIEHGRAIDANIRRFLTYHLTDNVAELMPFGLWALSAGAIPLAIGVLQVLALDLATDTLSAVSLGAEPAGRGTLEGPVRRRQLLDRAVAARAFLVLGPAEAIAAMIAFIATLMLAGWQPGHGVEQHVLAQASGTAFLAIVLGQCAAAFACRSQRLWIGAQRLSANRLLVGSKAIELALALGFLAIPAAAGLLGHALPTPTGLALALLAPAAVVTADWLAKRRLGTSTP